MSSEPPAEGTPPAPAADMVAIGVIRRPVGLKGKCYVDAFGKTLPGLVPPVRLWGGSAPSNVREIALREIRSSPRGLVCKFEGFDDMDAAGALRGWYLFCGREKLPPLPPGSHYHFELEGLTVIAAESGRAVGIVSAVQSYPAADALEVRKEDGSTILVSMTPGTMPAVDIERGTVAISESALEEIL
jgi:16S rRNA processing protein RimM